MDAIKSSLMVVAIGLVLRNICEGSKELYLNNWLASENDSINIPIYKYTANLHRPAWMYMIYFALESFMWVTVFSITSCLL